MYNKLFDLATEASKNELDKHISKEKTIKEKEKAVFLLHAYTRGYSYIEGIYCKALPVVLCSRHQNNLFNLLAKLIDRISFFFVIQVFYERSND